MRSTVDLDTVIGDMTLAHAAAPAGVPSFYDWAREPRLGLGNDPGDFEALLAWGQVYSDAAGNEASNTRVHIAGVKIYTLSKTTGEWTLIQDSDDVGLDGALFAEDFVDNANTPADIRDEPGGGVSVKLEDGFNFHFWPDGGRATIDPDDIAGVYASIDARLIADDPSKPADFDDARFLMSAGGDYWLDQTAPWDNFETNNDIGIGRFRYIEPEWDAFTMSTLSAAALRENPPPGVVVESAAVEAATPDATVAPPVDANPEQDFNPEPAEPIEELAPKSVELTPADPELVESKPSEAKPSETTPPAETAPARTTPAETASTSIAALLSLVNARSNEIVTRIDQNDALSPSLLGGDPLNLDVSFLGDGAGEIASVRFYLDGVFERLERVEPYALFGNRVDDYFNGSLEAGDHVVKIEAFDDSEGRGAPLLEETVAFTALGDLGHGLSSDETAVSPQLSNDRGPPIENSSDPLDDRLSEVDLFDLFVVDLETGATIGELRAGETVALDNLADRRVKIEARLNDNAEDVESVLLTLGETRQIQNREGYNFLFDDSHGSRKKLQTGEYDLAVAAYEKDNAEGAVLDQELFALTITENGMFVG